MISRPLCAFVAALALTTTPLFADVYMENGDAGQTLATAQSAGTVAGNPLTSITGTIGSGTDADVYRINITVPSTFSASTAGSSIADPVLFLFNGSGMAIVMNDDEASGLTLQSAIPAGNSFTMSLSPGIYYLAISLSGNEPINTVNQLLFMAGDSTMLRGPASGVNPSALNNFNGATAFPETGGYQITLTSTATVPEPSTLVLAAGGALGLCAWLRRRALRASA